MIYILSIKEVTTMKEFKIFLIYVTVSTCIPLPLVLPPNAPSQLYIFRHDHNMFCVYCTQVGVFK